METIKCKFCGSVISATATECDSCGYGTPYGIKLEEEQESEEALAKNTVALINCPACNSEVSNQAVACPKCGQPIKAAPPVKVSPASTFIPHQKGVVARQNKPGSAIKKFYDTWSGCLIITFAGMALLGGGIVSFTNGRPDKIPLVTGLILAPFAIYWLWFLVRVFRSKERRAALFGKGRRLALLIRIAGVIVVLAAFVLWEMISTRWIGTPVIGIDDLMFHSEENCNKYAIVKGKVLRYVGDKVYELDLDSVPVLIAVRRKPLPAVGKNIAANVYVLCSNGKASGLLSDSFTEQP